MRLLTNVLSDLLKPNMCKQTNCICENTNNTLCSQLEVFSFPLTFICALKKHSFLPK